MKKEKPKVIIIGGPTASGKTSLSIELAKAINGEIISADSMQIYKEMDIGTAKVTEKEMDGIKHYLVDFVSPEKRFSVAEFKIKAEEAIEEILSKNKTPIIVGGTGLYINSLLYNINFFDFKINKELRNKLEAEVLEKGLEYFYDLANKIDSEAMKNISKNDKKRILRIVEMYEETGKTKTELEKESIIEEVKYDYKLFINTAERTLLYDRINIRVDQMIQEGLIEEVQNIVNKYNSFPTSMQGLGYKEVVEYLQNKITKEEMIDKIKQETRRYAKRQITWFRRYKEAIWVNAEDGMENNLRIILGE